MTIISAFPSPAWLWMALCICMPVLLLVDVFARAPSARQAGVKTLCLSVMALGFAAALALCGPEATGKSDALAFLAAYVVELSLSVDNLFVFLLLFQSFQVQKVAINRVLSAGIFGALVLRALFIGSGLWLVQRFAWLFYVFGAFLLVSGLKLLKPETHDEQSAPAMPWPARVCRRLLPMASPEEEAGAPTRFFVRRHSPPRLVCTSLFLVLIAIEASDIVFALDSVPAGFAITQQGWLLFAANAMAILGLRALFVALDDSLRALRYLRPALALVLMFIGLKMLVAQVMEIPMLVSLGVIIGILAIAVTASVAFPEKPREKLP